MARKTPAYSSAAEGGKADLGQGDVARRQGSGDDGVVQPRPVQFGEYVARALVDGAVHGRGGQQPGGNEVGIGHEPPAGAGHPAHEVADADADGQQVQERLDQAGGPDVRDGPDLDREVAGHQRHGPGRRPGALARGPAARAGGHQRASLRAVACAGPPGCRRRRRPPGRRHARGRPGPCMWPGVEVARQLYPVPQGQGVGEVTQRRRQLGDGEERPREQEQGHHDQPEDDGERLVRARVHRVGAMGAAKAKPTRGPTTRSAAAAGECTAPKAALAAR